MLEQMSQFDIRAAKCTVASDRQLIEHQVVELWAEPTFSPDDGFEVFQTPRPEDREEALDRFNAYIRGPLKAAVVKGIGHEAHVPYHLCVIAFLPMNFYSLVNTLGCDSGPCETSAKSAGFDSVEWYLGAQAIAWLLCLFLAFPLTHPILLRLISLAMSHSEGHFQSLLVVLCCPLAYAYSYICGGLIWGMVFVSVQDYSPDWLLALLFYLAFLVAQAILIFRPPNLGHLPDVMKCTCAGRQVVVQWEEVRPMLPTRNEDGH